MFPFPDRYLHKHKNFEICRVHISKMHSSHYQLPDSKVIHYSDNYDYFILMSITVVILRFQCFLVPYLFINYYQSIPVSKLNGIKYLHLLMNFHQTIYFYTYAKKIQTTFLMLRVVFSIFYSLI